MAKQPLKVYKQGDLALRARRGLSRTKVQYDTLKGVLLTFADDADCTNPIGAHDSWLRDLRVVGPSTIDVDLTQFYAIKEVEDCILSDYADLAANGWTVRLERRDDARQEGQRPPAIVRQLVSVVRILGDNHRSMVEVGILLTTLTSIAVLMWSKLS